MLSLQNVGFFRAGRWFFRNLNAHFSSGCFLGLIGPNGAGKSTFLRLLSGELTPHEGEIFLDNQTLSSFSTQEIARKRAFLTQKPSSPFPFTVREVVSFGRFSLEQSLQKTKQKQSTAIPTTQALPPSNPRDLDAILHTVEMLPFAERLYPTLSGGEACRVDLARILAQETKLLLLDEPTNHLDPRYQLLVLSLCQQLAREGCLVIAALHDLNLAARYTDALLLLHDGQIISHGHPTDVLEPSRLEAVYQTPFEIHHIHGKPLILPMPRSPAFPNSSEAAAITPVLLHHQEAQQQSLTETSY